MQDGWMGIIVGGSPLPITVRPPVPTMMAFCTSNDIMRVELEPDGDLTMVTPAGPDSGNLDSNLAKQIGVWAEAVVNPSTQAPA